MPVQQGYGILGQYRQQVLARLEAASRRGAPQSEIRRLQAELRAIDRGMPVPMGAPAGVPTPPPPPTPGMPAMPAPTRTPSPMGTRIPAFATPMGGGQAGLPTLGPSTLWGGPMPRTPIAPAGGVPPAFLPGGAGFPSPGGGAGAADMMLLPGYAQHFSPDQLRQWLSMQAGAPAEPTWYQQQQAELAQQKFLWEQQQAGIVSPPTWYQQQEVGLGQAQFGLSQEKFAYQQQQDMLARQLAQQNLGMRQQEFGLEQKGLEQAWMIAQQQLIQSQREMAAAIGSQIAAIQGQTWAAGLPHELPRGTQFAPGMGPGGPASRLARMSGSQFAPMRIAPSPPPSPQQLMTMVQQAMGQFGPGR